METSPGEAIKNNVFGTYNLAKTAHEFGVEKFVMISTDKAVNPTNIMGASKRLCEMIIQCMEKISNTDFVAVRFGNVLGSNGSVIPLFERQISEGGPVRVTHRDVTRFFMTIPEAAQLVIQAACYAKGGEIFVLDMGKPVKIYDLAENLIRLSGHVPNVDIKIDIVGLRPGEKLYEELLMDQEGLEGTKHSKIFVGRPMTIEMPVLEEKLKLLKDAVDSKDNEKIRDIMEEVVPTYIRDNESFNRAHLKANETVKI
jgi:FlaA1/EpsC-like NDP-sugar epimerase